MNSRFRSPTDSPTRNIAHTKNISARLCLLMNINLANLVATLCCI